MTGLCCLSECIVFESAGWGGLTPSGCLRFPKLELMTEYKVSLEVAISFKSSPLYLFPVAPSGSFGSSSMEDADPAVSL